MTVKAAKKEYEHLKTVVFPELNVALLHGKLKPKEKGEIMNQYASGQVDILFPRPM
jgi:ATP-dependent DNA helicase RecG